MYIFLFVCTLENCARAQNKCLFLSKKKASLKRVVVSSLLLPIVTHQSFLKRECASSRAHLRCGSCGYRLVGRAFSHSIAVDIIIDTLRVLSVSLQRTVLGRIRASSAILRVIYDAARNLRNEFASSTLRVSICLTPADSFLYDQIPPDMKFYVYRERMR